MSLKIVCKKQKKQNGHYYHIVLVNTSPRRRKIIKNIASIDTKKKQINKFNQESYEYYCKHGAQVSRRADYLLRNCKRNTIK